MLVGCSCSNLHDAITWVITYLRVGRQTDRQTDNEPGSPLPTNDCSCPLLSPPLLHVKGVVAPTSIALPATKSLRGIERGPGRGPTADTTTGDPRQEEGEQGGEATHPRGGGEARERPGTATGGVPPPRQRRTRTGASTGTLLPAQVGWRTL